MKVGQFEGITVAALLEGKSAEEFSVAFHRYDVDREKRIRDFLLKVTSGNYIVTGGSVRFLVGRKEPQ